MPKGVPKSKEIEAEATDLAEDDVVETETKRDDELLDLLKGVAKTVGDLSENVDNLNKRVTSIETKGESRFKEGVRAEDVSVAREARKGLDPKVSQIVDSMLGADFGAEMKPLGDRPGFRFTIIVPTRLSDNVQDKRPVKEYDTDGNPTGKYVKDAAGNVVFEDYIPEDRRSRILAASDSYDAVKNHCEKVRGYIVGYFQKMNQPLPEFRVN